MSEVRTRFAPSPTGYMHIGNLRTALFAYFITKHLNGKYILRIEDTDQKRTIEEATQVIYDSLQIAGINCDESPQKGGEYGPYIQSQRKDLYAKYINILLEKENAFRCFCTKEEVEAQRAEQEQSNPNGIFRDKCRDLSKDQIAEKLDAGLPFVVRQRIPEEGQTTFSDLVYGDITIENNTLDEQVLMKSDGFPTYNFANVVDDHLMNITHVIRGYEYLSSSPKYNLLYQNFGWNIPEYIHLPHIMREDGKKLSKRYGDASFKDLMDKGYLPQSIINYISLLGWNPGTDEEIFTIEQLIEKFNTERISKSNAVFSYEKLDWINNQHIKKLSSKEFHAIANNWYPEEIKQRFDTTKLSEIIHQRLDRFERIPEILAFMLEVKDYDIELYRHKKMKSTPEKSIESLEKIIPVFQNMENFVNDEIFEAMVALAKEEEWKKGVVLWPIRIAISGLSATPGGASDIAQLLGKEETIKRIKAAIEYIKKNLKI